MKNRPSPEAIKGMLRIFINNRTPQKIWEEEQGDRHQLKKGVNV